MLLPVPYYSKILNLETGTKLQESHERIHVTENTDYVICSPQPLYIFSFACSVFRTFSTNSCQGGHYSVIPIAAFATLREYSDVF